MKYFLDRLIEKDRCPGSCGGNSYCDNGICVCDHKDGWVQVKDHLYRMVIVEVQQYLTKPNHCI